MLLLFKVLGLGFIDKLCLILISEKHIFDQYKIMKWL